MQRLRERHTRGVTAVASLTGQGPMPLVLLHGFPFDHHMWEPQILALESEARILAPDFLGLGRSQPPPSPLSMDDYADDVLAWMDDARMERAVIAGLSMGGYVAFALWRMAPERVAALGLFDTKAEADTEEGKRGRLETRKAIGSRGMSAVVDGMLEKVLSKMTRRARLDVVERVRRMILETSPEGAMTAVDALRERPDSRPDLPGIRVPTVVLVGEHDELTPPPVAQAMAERIPGARLVIVPGAGHVSSLEAPERVTTALRELIRSV